MFLIGRESLIVPYLNVLDRYHSYTNYFLLVADFCTDKVHRLTNISISTSCVRGPLVTRYMISKEILSIFFWYSTG